ncbi:hypothetical protein HIM_06210 [Hirsutella minnesotensis 3608]|uniref:Uncharacterized protein n=1 Tax=Hirsutella minnesotensis 3608 TaxID=1043627 RepID=A0A0F7ZNV3_9HYPO|nr:hypothetical protein HIM_06210 [Hirsutella minnesotensis 3608]
MAQQGCRIRIRRDIRSRRQVQSPDDDQLMAESPPSAAAQPPLALVAQLPQAVAQPLGAQRSPPLRSRLMAASAGDVPYIKVGELPPAAGYPAQAPPAPSHVRLPQPGPPAAVNPPPRTLTRVQNSDSDSRLRVDNLVSPASAPRLRIDYLVSPKSPSPPTASHQPYSAPDQCQSGPELAPMEDAARQGSSKRRLTGLASSGMDPGEPQTRPAHVHRHPG